MLPAAIVEVHTREFFMPRPDIVDMERPIALLLVISSRAVRPMIVNYSQITRDICLNY
jgi:hypothetical protein